MTDQYDEIINAEITDDYNEIDKARDLLKELLDDPEVGICDQAGAIIQTAINFIE